MNVRPLLIAAQRVVLQHHSRFWFAAAGAIVLAGICLLPLNGAWFHRDDFWLLSLARYTTNPLYFWTYDHSAFYFFRPATMTLWWCSVALWGSALTAHYALNALLHCAVALSFGLWMRAFARSPTVGGFAIRFYAVHPVAVRTTMWLSDRFDLMATTRVFAACALFLHPSHAKLRRAGLRLLTLSSCLSKKTGVALLALVAVHFMFRRHAVSDVACRFWTRQTRIRCSKARCCKRER